jgi:hypothetical protein
MLRFPYHARYELIEFAVFTLAARAQGLVPLHAACVGEEGRGLLLMGESGAGKSTASLHWRCGTGLCVGGQRIRDAGRDARYRGGDFLHAVRFVAFSADSCIHDPAVASHTPPQRVEASRSICRRAFFGGESLELRGSCSFPLNRTQRRSLSAASRRTLERLTRKSAVCHGQSTGVVDLQEGHCHNPRLIAQRSQSGEAVDALQGLLADAAPGRR